MNAKVYRLLVTSLFIVVLFSGSALAETTKERLDQAERALRSGELITAEQLFRALIAEDDMNLSSRLGLADTLIKQKRFAEAVEQASVVLRQKPSAQAHALLGNVSRFQGDFQGAVAHYRTALKIEENGLAVGGLATIDFYENRLSESIRGLRRAVQLERNEPEFYFYLAQVATKVERYSEAADAYSKYLAVAPAADANLRARVAGLITFLNYLKGQGKLYRAERAAASEVELDVTGNLPTFKVRLNESDEEFRFVLDTGSGMTVISDKAATRLNIKVAARGGRANAVGGQFEIVYALLRSIDIGDVRIANVPVYIRPILDEKNHVDGYIGLPAIARFITTLDYARKRFGLIRLDTPEAAVNRNEMTAFKIPIRSTSGGFLSGEVSIENLDERLSFIIDTGSSISVLSRELGALEQVRLFKTGVPLRVYGGGGVVENVTTRFLPRIALGTSEQRNVLAAVLDLNPISESAGFRQTGIIGGNFLSQFRVVFDLSRSEMRLVPEDSHR